MDIIIIYKSYTTLSNVQNRFKTVSQTIACLSDGCRVTSSGRQLSSYGRRAFCVAGPLVWNSLLGSLRDPIIGGNSFSQSLKTFLFATY